MNYYNYFTEIEETFVRRRGKNLLLSPLDWALIEDWQNRGIPMHVVIRAIETVFDTFDKQPIRPRTIKSLLYCREEIEAQYSEWAALQTGTEAVESNGNDEELSVDVIAEHIAAVSEKLTNARSAVESDVSAAIDRVLARLAELMNDREDTEKLEKSLDALDRVIDDTLAAGTSADVVRKSIEKQLRAFKHSMEPEAYKRTLDLMTIKRLREDHGLPRLSLFYL